MNDQTLTIDEGRSRAAFMCGIAGLCSLLVPPGLLVSPVAGIAAIVLGLTHHDRRDGVTAVALGVVTLLAWALVVFTFRHLITQVLTDINAGR